MHENFRKLLTLSQVCERTGLKKSAIYSRIKHKNFPPPIKIGRASRWDSSAVNSWVENAINRTKTQ